MTPATAYRAALVVIAAVGLARTWIGLSRTIDPLVLFTVQSNVLLAAYCCVRIAGRWRPGAGLGGAVTLYIVVTGLVWNALRWVVGNPFAHIGLAGLGLGNLLLHYVTPIMAVIDWLVLDREGGRPRWTAAFAWLAYPAVYLAFALVRGALLPPGTTEKRYPYPFLDVHEYGYDGVALMAGVLAAAVRVNGPARRRR